MKLFISILFAALLIGIVALNMGAYNMAATDKHWKITEKIIEWVRESSIEARAEDLEVPPLDNKDLIKQGARHYSSMCTSCHSAPGKEPTELARGLYPQAPVFHKRDRITDPAEISAHAKKYFWVIKNGLKMTAMPAWGLSHDDDDIWAMTAFLFSLSGMSPEQYEELADQDDQDDHNHSHH